MRLRVGILKRDLAEKYDFKENVNLDGEKRGANDDILVVPPLSCILAIPQVVQVKSLFELPGECTCLIIGSVD